MVPLKVRVCTRATLWAQAARRMPERRELDRTANKTRCSRSLWQKKNCKIGLDRTAQRLFRHYSAGPLLVFLLWNGKRIWPCGTSKSLCGSLNFAAIAAYS